MKKTKFNKKKYARINKYVSITTDQEEIRKFFEEGVNCTLYTPSQFKWILIRSKDNDHDD